MTIRQEIKKYMKLKLCCFTFAKITTHLNEKGEEKKKLIGCPTTEQRNNLTVDSPYFQDDHKCVGIMTGKRSNITVIDCDNAESYNKFLSEYPEFKDYYTVKTNKGYHIYCKFTDKVKSCINKMKDGVDILSDNYFVIAPPTSYKLLNKTIASYEFIGGKIKEFPKYLIDRYSETIVTKIDKTSKPKNNIITNTIEIVDITLTPKQQNLIKYINILNKDYYDNYQNWVKVGMLCYSLDLCISTFIQFSKQSEKYVEGDCETKWASFDKKSYTVGTLYWLAKESNSKAFYELKMNDQFNAVYDLPMVELIGINQRYLLDKISEDHYEICTEMRKHLDNLFNTDTKVLNIKSPYGTSKTQLMIKAIEEYKPKRILMLSYRQTLTLDLKKNFEHLGFEDYLTGNIEADRVIIQLESLYKLNSEEIVKQYDLVLIDESERVLNHFSSHTTFNGREHDTFEYLHNILKGSKKIICLDGGQTNRTYNYMSNFACLGHSCPSSSKELALGKNISIVNKAKVHENEIHFMDNFELWTNDIIEDLKNGLKVVIPGMSAAIIQEFKDKLVELFPEKKVELFTGDTDSKRKMEAAKDVINEWSQLDCLLYSPCFEAGVNFDKKHFDKQYIYLCSGSCSQEALYQMIARVRHFTCNIYKTFKGTMKDHETAFFWTYEEVKAGMIENRELILKPVYVEKNGYILQTYALEPYNINCIYNKVEELNKNHFYFLPLFKMLGQQKGYKFVNLVDPFEDEGKHEKTYKNKLEPILAAEDIDLTAFQELLRKQRNNLTTEKEKIIIEKQMYKLNLGLDEINEDVMKCYYRKTSTVKNYFYLLHDDLLHDKNTYHAEEQNSRLVIVRKLIKLLGWQHINDNKVFTKDEFDENVINALGKSEAFTDRKTKVIFNMSKSTINLKGDFNALRYINELLKGFNIKIETFYSGDKILKNKRYKLSEMNNVSELVYYLINRGKLQLCNDHHFVEPENKRYYDLYKPNKKIESDLNTALLDVNIVDIWEEEE